MNITDFIKNYYDVIYQGENVNIEDLDNVDEFLLGDVHTSLGYSEINSLFINSFSNQNDAVLVEAQPSLQQVNQNAAFQAVWLTTESKIFGWDTGTIEQILGLSVFQQLANVELEGQILQRKLLNPNFSDKREEIKSELAWLSYKALPLMLELSEQTEYLVDRIEKTFPERVKSMKDSLMKIKEISSRTFLISGLNHLKQLNSSHSLGDFYEFLSSRNVVILFPKEEKAEEMGKIKKNALI